MKASALRAAFVIGAGYTLVAGPFACERRSGVGGNGASAGVENGSLPGVPGPRLPGGAQVGSSRSTNPGTAGAGTAGAPPGGDPGWQNVSWAPACNGVQVATDARYAVPELEWQACEGVPGCERLVVNWSSSINIPYQIASLYKRDGTLRLSMHMWFEQEWRKAVYADARTPIAAWRGPFGQAEHCGGLFIATTARGICLLMANEGQARQVVRSLAEPAGDPIAQFDTSAADSDGCMDQIFAGVSGGGSDFVLDISGGTQHEITPAAGTVFGLRPHADMVFFTRFDATGAQEVLDGWIWSNAGGSRRIVAPDGDNMVYDIRGSRCPLRGTTTTRSRASFGRAHSRPTSRALREKESGWFRKRASGLPGRRSTVVTTRSSNSMRIPINVRRTTFPQPSALTGVSSTPCRDGICFGFRGRRAVTCTRASATSILLGPHS
jgi:hypothetical protein